MPSVIVFYTIDATQHYLITIMIPLPDAPEGSSLWSLGAGALGALIYLRKFLSRQNVEINKDSAESNLIKTLQEERDKALAAAHEAWKSKAEDAKLIGELTSEVRALRNTVLEMKAELDSVARLQRGDQ